MITAEQFKDAWENPSFPIEKFMRKHERLVPIPDELAGLSQLPEPIRKFMSASGLPGSAAPFLSFNERDDTLKTYAGVAQADARFNRYLVIGSDGGGNMICLDDQDSYSVVLLDHDNSNAADFMNSSVPQLAECLLAYRELVHRTNEENGPDAYLDGEVPKEVAKWFIDRVTGVDPAALKEGAFWDSASCHYLS